MCRSFLALSLSLFFLASCGSKEKKSTTLNKRASYISPALNVGEGDVPERYESQFTKIKVRVWRHLYGQESGEAIGGEEFILPVDVPTKKKRRLR